MRLTAVFLGGPHEGWISTTDGEDEIRLPDPGAPGRYAVYVKHGETVEETQFHGKIAYRFSRYWIRPEGTDETE